MFKTLNNTVFRGAYFLEFTANQTQDEFVAQFPDPFLHVLVDGTQADSDFATRAAVSMDSLLRRRKTGVIAPDSIVYYLAKRKDANRYGSKVMIGRAENCDLVVSSADVSKFHAYITFNQGFFGAGYQLADGQSTNGTRLDGKVIRPGKQYPLTSGAKIRLGDVFELVFYESAAFYVILKNSESDLP